MRNRLKAASNRLRVVWAILTCRGYFVATFNGPYTANGYSYMENVSMGEATATADYLDSVVYNERQVAANLKLVNEILK